MLATRLLANVHVKTIGEVSGVKRNVQTENGGTVVRETAFVKIIHRAIQRLAIVCAHQATKETIARSLVILGTLEAVVRKSARLQTETRHVII